MRLKNKDKNKKINFKKADVLGTVIYKPRKAYILEEISLNKYKLGEKELKKIFPGDLVSCSISNKGWATINKVIQTNTKEVLTELRSSNKKWVATPISFGHQFNISIEGKTPDKMKNGSLSVGLSLKKYPEAWNQSPINACTLHTKNGSLSVGHSLKK